MDAAIYNCNWYLMPVPLQRVFLLMLMRAQNPTVLKSGTVVLNLNLFVAVSLGDCHKQQPVKLSATPKQCPKICCR